MGTACRLDACLEQPFEKKSVSLRRFTYNHPEESPHLPLPFNKIPGTPT